MVSVEQMIPLSGKNRSKERAAAAEALGVFEEARRQELDVIARAKASYYQIANLYQLLDINKADEASLIQSLDATRAKFELGTQTQADLLLADNERQKIIETRRDLTQKISEEESALNVLMDRDPCAPLARPFSSNEHLVQELVAIARALGDPTRIRIVAALRKGELCVCELVDALDISQSSLSSHLQICRQVGVVTTRKESRWIYYSLSPRYAPLIGTIFAELQVVGYLSAVAENLNLKCLEN